MKPTTIAKKYLFVLFAILLALQTFSATGFAAKDAETVAEAEVVFHYQAASQDTREWQLWVWNEAGGESVTFDAADDFGMLATVKLPKETSKINYAVRLPDGTEQDCKQARSLNIINNKAEVWLFGGTCKVLNRNPLTEPVEVNQAQVEKPKTTLPDAGMGGMTLDITAFLAGALILMLIFARVRRTVKK